MDIDSPDYVHRVTEGLYDNVVEQLLDLPKGMYLGGATYNSDFMRDANVHTGNFAYRSADTMAKYETVLMGEIRPQNCGTKFSAIGNHYLGSAPTPNVIQDKSRVKGVFALGKPTNSTELMSIAFDNQLATLDEILQSDLDELKRKNKDINIKEWTAHVGAETKGVPDHIMVHTAPLYAVSGAPQSRLRGAPVQSLNDLQVPRSVQQVADGHRAKIMKRALAKADEDGETAGGVPDSTASSQITTNDFYDPAVLPDYGGEIFQHENAKLCQLDFRDAENNLIPPARWYSELRGGALVMVRATLNAYNWDGRRVYQLNAKTIRVLDQSRMPMPPIQVFGDKSGGTGVGASGPSAASQAMAAIQLGKRLRT